MTATKKTAKTTAPTTNPTRVPHHPTSASHRLLARGVSVSNDTRETGLNNNDLIVGPSGTGKTGGYVVPNLATLDGSLIVTDTKGNLARNHGDALRARGFRVHTIDFGHPERSSAYNPLQYIRRSADGYPNTLDLTTVARALVPPWKGPDRFWEDATVDLVALAIGLTLEMNDPDQHTMAMAVTNLSNLGFTNDQFNYEVAEWIAAHPDGFVASRFASTMTGQDADKMWASIRKLSEQALMPFDIPERRPLFAARSSFQFEDLGKEPTVVFLNVSDTDRTSDYAANLFYTQALQALCGFADAQPDSRLPVPVRLILDDFASSATIPDFDRIISVIRSREISVSIIVQSLTQLQTMYSETQAMTIINNCDHVLYLGGHDLQTADYVAHRMGRSPETVMALPRSKAYLLESGAPGRTVDKIAAYSVGVADTDAPQAAFGTARRDEADHDVTQRSAKELT